MSFAPVYLFLGPETGEKARETAALRARFVKERGGEIEDHVFYGFDDGVEKVVNIARSGALFSSGSFLIFRNAELLKGSFDALAQYVKNPSPDSILVFQSDEVGATKTPGLKNISGLLPKTSVKIFWEMFESQRLSWLISYIKDHDGTISREAAEAFLDLVENNSENMARECDKLLLLHGDGREISLEDIESYIFHSKEENAYTVFAYLSQRDLGQAMEGLQKIFASGDNQGIQVMSGLVRQFRTLGGLKSEFPRGAVSHDVLKQHGVLFKRAQGVYNNALQQYSPVESARILKLAGEYEFALREFRGGWHQRLLELFCYQVVVRGGQGQLLGSSEDPDTLGIFGLTPA